MDGFQGALKQSLQFRLSAWLSLIILVGALAASIFSFVSAFQEAIELQDDQLRQMVALINRQHWSVTQAKSQADGLDADPESRVVLQLMQQAGQRFGELPGLAVDVPDGMQTVTINHLSWRVFVKTLDSGSRVALGQRTAERDEIAHDSALRTLMPFLILIPILLLLVSDLIHKMFRVLTRMAADLDQRSEQDLRAIADTHVPSEIRPFVVAINRLLARVAQSVAVQRRFVADAAHELRSPLTALSLQAERLEAADMSTQASERLTALRKGIQRTRSLLEQLLTLARVQELSYRQSESVSLQSVFRQVLEDLMPLAEAKDLDVGVVSAEDAHIMAQEAHLKTLLKNLVDNAIRYTPDGGQIDLYVRTTQSSVILQVEDTGPGIPEAERDRVFDPFYRVVGQDEVGSGLGLAIVQTIAEQLGADLSLGYANEQTKSGLRVKVTFPINSVLCKRTPDQ
ncbi:ATP-binding protein [Anthocerotibacter panamensis]|uniref:ATP-binding protein n=1 Tax=Anthocerotibacter panamensis TaxID=2857077 RepID=UPI001C401C76|nr:ATP-binding protein [Anthocerotibacter panamensis]